MTLFYRPALFAAVTFMLLSAAPVHADWGFTQWGMSREDVMRASKGSARDTNLKEIEKRSPDDMSLTALSAARQQLGRLHGTQYFLFDKEGRLARVDVYVPLPKSTSLESTLSGIFGAPVEHKNSWAGRTFQWKTQGENIILMEVDNNASVIITPRKI